VFDGIATKEQM